VDEPALLYLLLNHLEVFMKMIKKPVRFLLALIAATVVISGGFFACGADTPPYEMSSQAVLTGLSIASVTVDEDAIPAAIHPDDWANWDFPLVGVDTTTMYFARDNDIVNVRIRPVASARSRVDWGIGDRLNRPNVFVDTRVTATFKAFDYLYLRVTSEDTRTVNYYRFDAVVYKSGIDLDALYVEGKRFNVSGGHPEWGMAAEGTLPITEPQALSALIRAVAFEDTSTFRFARVPALATIESDPETVPVFRPRSTTQVTEGQIQIGEDDEGNPLMGANEVDYFRMDEEFTDQDLLYVEVTAQNQVDVAIYKFLVSVGRIANIAKLGMVDKKSILNNVAAKGSPNMAWGSSGPGKFAVAYYDQPTDGFAVTIELEDDDATYEYAVVTDASTEPAYTASKTNPRPMPFANGDTLVIKVTSVNGRAWMYYKIAVELLATKFTQQPRSAVYYYCHTDDPKTPAADYKSPTVFESDTPLPLTFTLEDESGDYSYQWYESNSWYGGYGFDKDGRVTYAGGANSASDTEDGFIEDQYHDIKYDEKSNITLFNGGNKNVRYVIPGRKISSADITAANKPENFNLDQGTDRAYTPKINFRPFLPNYTNETHYYYVEITDNVSGYKLVSERAVIVSERDKSKKHLIFDTNNWENPTTHEKLLFKNGPDPFKEKYDKFRIPLFLDQWRDPEDPTKTFNPTDYSTFTAQAKFYLTDGKDWIQNWTQGNISFEDNSEKPDIPAHGPGGTILVLYYNLTNDNAAKSLDSGGNEPSAGGVHAIPTHVVIEPSGDHTKGADKDGYPLNPDGSFKEPDNMQGWFCGFIELVEFRFEGPARGD
jgi:hypothetical protein